MQGHEIARPHTWGEEAGKDTGKAHVLPGWAVEQL